MSAAAAASVAAERQRLTLELEAEQQRRKDMASSMRGLLDALRPQASASPPAESPCDPEIRDVAELLRQLKTVAERTDDAGASGQPQKKKPQRKKRAKAASRSPAAQTPPSSAKPRRRPASAAPSRSKGGPRAQQRRASLPARRPPSALMSPSPSLPGSRSVSRRAAAAAETQRQSAAAFDKSVSAHKRHTHARHAGMVRCTARTPSSGALPAPHPSRQGSGRAAVHRISRGQSVVVTPLDPAR